MAVGPDSGLALSSRLPELSSRVSCHSLQQAQYTTVVQFTSLPQLDGSAAAFTTLGPSGPPVIPSSSEN